MAAGSRLASAAANPPKAAAPAPAPSPASERSAMATQADAGIDQIRAVTKWMITAFAGVAGLMLAGVQLTSLGQTSGWRLVFAGLSLAVALTATMIAIYLLTEILKPMAVGPDDATKWADDPATPFGKFVAGHPGAVLPEGITSGKDLYDKYTAARAKANSPAATEQEKSTARRRRNQLANLVWFATFVELDAAFKTTRIKICIAAAVVAAGITAFVWAANPDTSKAAAATAAPAVNPQPVQVRVLLNNDGRRHFGTTLGAKCAAAATTRPGVNALAISADAAHTTVVLIPEGPCTSPVMFSLSVDDGIATAAAKVKPATR